MSAQVRIRDARPDDVGRIFGWIVELAEYERAPEQVRGTPDLLEEALFGADPTAEAVIAETREDDADWDVNVHNSFALVARHMRSSNVLRRGDMTEHERITAPYGALQV